MDAKNPARVSVIIPTKDRSALLREALASVRSLAGPDLDLEVIVVDNGSTDDTEVVARSYGARFERTLTPGAAAARNVGLRVATGEYIAFLDDDDVWLSGHLRPHLQLLASRPDLDAIVGQVQQVDQFLNPFGAPYPAALPSDGNCFEAFLDRFPQIGATVVRASVRETVGYFDEWRISSEEYDWHLRLALRHRIGFIAAPCMLFRLRASGQETEDRLVWMRVGCWRAAFWTNLRRAGSKRPAPHVIARSYFRWTGTFVRIFMGSAVVHAEAGNTAAARRALLWAVRTSPINAGRELLRQAVARKVLVAVLVPSRPKPSSSAVVE